MTRRLSGIDSFLQIKFGVLKSCRSCWSLGGEVAVKAERTADSAPLWWSSLCLRLTSTVSTSGLPAASAAPWGGTAWPSHYRAPLSNGHQTPGRPKQSWSQIRGRTAPNVVLLSSPLHPDWSERFAIRRLCEEPRRFSAGFLWAAAGSEANVSLGARVSVRLNPCSDFFKIQLWVEEPESELQWKLSRKNTTQGREHRKLCFWREIKYFY